MDNSLRHLERKVILLLMVIDSFNFSHHNLRKWIIKKARMNEIYPSIAGTIIHIILISANIAHLPLTSCRRLELIS